ncbi:hypothetical protein, partial [Citrobacter freundii]|uniref:hypothetical protein n=1 Tax=Citrobacter freundii TaxID=546 RepID=UPI000E2A6AAA
NLDVAGGGFVVKDHPVSAGGGSSDIVRLYNNLQPEIPQTAGIPITSTLNILVGNNVRLYACGLTARLPGDLIGVLEKQGLGRHGQI